jgi:hypothetical protein
MTTKENRENKVWESEGLLWQNLAIYETVEGMVGVMSNSKSFMNDQEMTFPDDMMFMDMIEKIKTEDAEFYNEMALYGEEG